MIDVNAGVKSSFIKKFVINAIKMFNAKKYDKIYPNREGEINFLLKYLKGKTVLDVGGGTGIISEVLNKKGFECWNIEPQKEMTEISKKREVITNCMQIEDYVANSKFDNVIMVFDVFNFLDDPETALRNIAKMLKGKLIFTYWNSGVKRSGWAFNWKLKRITRKRWNGDRVEIDFWFPFFHEKHRMTVYSDKTILEMLASAGFKILEKQREKFTTKIIAEI